MQRALQVLRALPTVESAAAVTNLPLERLNWRTRITFEDSATPVTEGINARIASDGYFATLGVGLIAGRDFARADDHGTPPVIIVNAAFARRYLAEASPLGRRLTLTVPLVGEQQTHTVIGVVADMNERVDAGPAPEIYLPLAQQGWPNVKIVYRARADATAEGVRRAVAGVDADVPIDWHRPMAEIVGAGIAQQRFLAQLLSIFAALSVVLAGAGIFALAGHGVQARQREIGVRLAIGAGGGEIVGMVMVQSMRWALRGD